MMKKTNIYEVIKDIISTKSGELHKCFNFNQAVTSNYILQRWISMDTPETTHLVNETTNKLWLGLDDNKELWYKLLSTLINKKTYRKIIYIKKKERIINEKRDKEIEEFVSRYQLSKREILEYYKVIDKLNKET